MSKKVNINNQWKFIKSDCERVELNNQSYEIVDIPHCWNGQDGQDGGNDYHRGLCWYVKEVDAITSHEGAVYLDFEGANSVCDVYFNGTHLGKHEGGYSGFRYDVTNLIKSVNTIEVGVDNSHFEHVYPLWADFTFYGGLYRDVNFIYDKPVHFDKLDLASSGVYVTQSDVSKAKADCHVTAKVNNMDKESHVTCHVSMMDADGQIITNESLSKIVSGKDSFDLDITLENPHLWQGVEDPYLYTCVVTLEAEDMESDRVEIKTGLRYFKFDEHEGFFLNGKHMKLNGVSRHQDRLAVGNALTKEHQIEDMELIKEIGANSIRLAHYQHNQFFYDLCDREGMVVWAEIPYISKTSDTDETASNAISQMRELIRQSYNHSSILMWGVQNEIGIGEETKSLQQIVKEIHDVVKEEDTSRVTTQAQVMMIPEDDPSHYETDIMAWNKYYGWYVGEAEEFDDFIHDFRRENPNRGFGISEYGAEGILRWHTEEPKVKDYTEEYHSLYHEKVIRIFDKYPFIWGTYVWNMFDFGSDLRDEGGIQGRNNKGLVTFDRKIKKDAFYMYQAHWSKKPMLHITSKRFVNRHLSSIRLKVYSNQASVVLSCNGVSAELLSQEGSVFVFKVDLKEGENKLVATAGGLSDQAVFNKVADQDMSYVLPEEEGKKGIFSGTSNENVENWFNSSEAISEDAFTYPEGYLSIKDKIKVILQYEEGEVVLRKYLAPMFEHAMFKMAKKMPLDKIFSFQADAFPKPLQLAINQELTRIKK